MSKLNLLETSFCIWNRQVFIFYGLNLQRFFTWVMFDLYRFQVYSGFDLDRFHCKWFEWV